MLACGGSFIAALGKDVPEGQAKKKKNASKDGVVKHMEDSQQQSVRSRS